MLHFTIHLVLLRHHLTFKTSQITHVSEEKISTTIFLKKIYEYLKNCFMKSCKFSSINVYVKFHYIPDRQK